jgi:hypothetical protein
MDENVPIRPTMWLGNLEDQRKPLGRKFIAIMKSAASLKHSKSDSCISVFDMIDDELLAVRNVKT